MNLKTDQITKVIQDQIKSYGVKTKQDEIGYVIQVGDGIAKVHGLDRCRANELLRFDGGAVGMALNLEEDCVSVVMLGSDVGVEEGSLVRRTGEVLSVPVGEKLIGRVVDAIRQECAPRGVRFLRLDTGTNEPEVRDIYLKAGFQIVKTLYNHGTPSMLLYELEL